jgi:spermidine synthase
MDSFAAPSPASSTEEEPPISAHIPVPVVSEDAGVLTLHFQSDYVQSQMLVGEPDSLALAYSRTMMAFELFVPDAQQIAMIGLGGGSMAKWCYRHHPQADLTVVEINPHVIALRDRFQIPEDDRRFRILCEDGTKFVERISSKFDVLLVDAFATDHLPPELCSQRFYDDCYQTLRGSGLMVVNLCEEDNRPILARIRETFNGRVLLSPDSDGNTVVFACKGKLLWPKGESAGSLQMKLRKFEKKYGLSKAMAPVS